MSLRRLQQFYSELRSRRVFGAVTAYIVAAFVLLQAADLLFRGLHFPERAFSILTLLLIALFPLVLVGAWLVDVTPRGFRWTTSPGSSARGRRFGLIASTLGAVMLFAAAFAVRMGAHTRVADGDLAVLPFAATGGADADSLASAIPRLLSTNVDGIDLLRPIDPALVERRARHRTVTPALAAEIAGELNARWYVTGRVTKLGAQVRVEADLFNTDNQRRAVAHARADAEPDRYFDVVDELSRQLLAEKAELQLGRLSRLTTTSLDALRSYLAGERAFHRGEMENSVSAWQAALAADSTFALAAAQLVVSATWMLDMTTATAAAQRAQQYADRLSDRDRKLLAANVAFLHRDNTRAEALYREILSVYRNDAAAWYMLGELLLHTNFLRGRSAQEADSAFARAIALQPDHVEAIHHRMWLALMRGDSAAAGAFGRRILRADTASEFTVSTRVLLEFTGDGSQKDRAVLAALDSAADFVGLLSALMLYDVADQWPSRVAAVMRPLTTEQRAATTRVTSKALVASALAASGQWHSAASYLASAEQDDPGRALIERALLELTPGLPVTVQELRGTRAALQRAHLPAIAENPGSDIFGTPGEVRPGARLYCIALLSLKLGDVATTYSARDSLVRLAADPNAPPQLATLAQGVNAALAMARNDAAGALQILEARPFQMPYIDIWTTISSYGRERYLRAAALHAIGRDEEALHWLGTFGEGPPQDVSYLPAVLRMRGEIHERQGQLQDAIHDYTRLLRLWANPDAALQPQRTEIQTRLARLTQR